MNSLKILGCALALIMMASCDREDEDVVIPRNPEEFPIVILLSDEGDGDLEDNDEVGIALEILPVWDPVTRSPEGKISTPTTDMQINFEIFDALGFANLEEYITGGFAAYEIDDCTSSADLEIDLQFNLDLASGTGSFMWPAGVAELEVVIEVSDVFFDDDVLNTDQRGFSFKITGIEGLGAGNTIRVNTDLEFEYIVLDNEAIFSAWEFDHTDPDQFAAFLALFGQLNEDFQNLNAADVDKIEISFGFEGMEVVVALLETEEDECEPGAFESVELEVSAEYSSDLEDLFGALSGDLEFEGAAEIDGVESEFALAGSFKIDAVSNSLTLIIQGELDGDEIGEQTLQLTR
jgi:hypothetical protein